MDASLRWHDGQKGNERHFAIIARGCDKLLTMTSEIGFLDPRSLHR